MLAGIRERVGGAWSRRPDSFRSRPRRPAAPPASQGAPRRPQRRLRAAERAPATASANGSAPKAGELREMRAQRDRLVEKFTIMEADLGGAFYEMAIRDHVRLDVLTRKAAELQRVDAELAGVEAALELERSGADGICDGCGAPYGAGTRFCGQCGNSLTDGVAAA